MRKQDLRIFIKLYKELNEIAKRKWVDKGNSLSNFHGIIIEHGKIKIANDDGFYGYFDDETNEILEEILPDDLIF